MAKAVFLDFEKDLGEIHKKIEELENKELETGVSENEALTELKRKMRTRRRLRSPATPTARTRLTTLTPSLKTSMSCTETAHLPTIKA